MWVDELGKLNGKDNMNINPASVHICKWITLNLQNIQCLKMYPCIKPGTRYLSGDTACFSLKLKLEANFQRRHSVKHVNWFYDESFSQVSILCQFFNKRNWRMLWKIKTYKEERKTMQFIFDCSYSATSPAANSPISQKEFVDKTRSFAMSNDCERLDQAYQSRSFFLSTKWWKELENSKFTLWLKKHVFIAELYFYLFYIYSKEELLPRVFIFM